MNKVIAKVYREYLLDHLEAQVNNLKNLIFEPAVRYIESFDIRSPNEDSFNQVLGYLDNVDLKFLCEKENQNDVKELLDIIKAVDKELFPNRLFPYDLGKK